MRELVVSIGGSDPAEIKRTWRGDFAAFVAQALKGVKDTEDKAARGWVCGAEFTNKRRHGENFVARHLLSLDYDHITPEDRDRILGVCGGTAHVAYTTWSHDPARPRLRVWIPLSRPASNIEFQAISRKFASRADIELAARESHTPAQFMYRPASKAGVAFQHWEDTEAPYLDVDKVLGEYVDYKDRSTWPHRKENDSCHEPTPGESPLEKPGIIGEWCRAFTISHAIERFQLPYTPGSSEGRWTYSLGSRADGAVAYDEDTKLHSYHDTDPARGQHNAYDLVRLHRFGSLDDFDGDAVPIADRESSRAMAAFAAEQPEIAGARFAGAGFIDLDAAGIYLPAAGVADSPGPVARSLREGAASMLPEPLAAGSTANSDLENARRIQRLYGHKVITVGKAFHVWTGSHWAKDEASVKRMIAGLSFHIQNEARAMAARDAEDEGAKARMKWADRSCSTAAMSACENQLRPLLDVKAELLNAQHHLLVCRSGTIDLRDGTVRPSRATDFITACADVNYVPGAPAPRFKKFLLEIFEGDEELVAFAKRWFGYCTTGETTAHSIVFHVGEGGNGKSLLMKVLTFVLGAGYAAKGARSLLTSGGTGASPEMADLLGRRMVTLSETNREEEFNEGLLKELTGGDRIKARNLFESYLEFDPTHKLQVFTNYEPRITGQDRGLWRRIFLLPYEVKFGRPDEVAAGIATEEQDERLMSTLSGEAEGILAWLVEGAREWYAGGLRPPPAVLRRTEQFRAEQDIVGQFLKEKTVRDPEGRVPFTHGTLNLYVAYKGWLSEMGYKGVLSLKRLIKEVRRAAPYAHQELWKTQGATCRGFRGFRLTEDPLGESGAGD